MNPLGRRCVLLLAIFLHSQQVVFSGKDDSVSQTSYIDGKSKLQEEKSTSELLLKLVKQLEKYCGTSSEMDRNVCRNALEYLLGNFNAFDSLIDDEEEERDIDDESIATTFFEHIQHDTQRAKKTFAFENVKTERKGKREYALPRSGKREFALPRSGKREYALPRSGKRGMSLPRSGKREFALPRSGKREYALPRSGKRESKLPRSGKREFALPRSGKRESKLPRSGKRGMSLPRSGKREFALPRSGKRESKLPRSGKRGMSLPRSGKREFALPRSGKREIELQPLTRRAMITPRSGKQELEMPRSGKRETFLPRSGKREMVLPRSGKRYFKFPRRGNRGMPRSGDREASANEKKREYTYLYDSESGIDRIRSSGRQDGLSITGVKRHGGVLEGANNQMFRESSLDEMREKFLPRSGRRSAEDTEAVHLEDNRHINRLLDDDTRQARNAGTRRAAFESLSALEAVSRAGKGHHLASRGVEEHKLISDRPNAKRFTEDGDNELLPSSGKRQAEKDESFEEISHM